MTSLHGCDLWILGAGSWGTALAIALARRDRESGAIVLWCRRPDHALALQQSGENTLYLPGFPLPTSVQVTHDPGRGMRNAGVILVAVPSQALRTTLAALRPHIAPSALLVSATKGLEAETCYRMSQTIADSIADRTAVSVLSGPSFAREVARGDPTALVIGSESEQRVAQLQRFFAAPGLRFYGSTDVIGIETGAALKNVIAIAAGICTGLHLGSNSVAALVTRGLAEITRLAVRLGGRERTLSGLAGLGDLVLTATGDLSRNRQVGLALAQGHTLSDIVAASSMVAEGISTCRVAYQLAQRESVETPIVNQIYSILWQAKDARTAIGELMDRPLTIE